MSEFEKTNKYKRKKNWFPKILLAIIFLAAATIIWQKDENDYREKPDCLEHLKTPVGTRFDLAKNGTVIDRETGLEWYRCNAGQRFINNKCSGDALLFNWEDAMAFPTELSNLSSLKWRLPTNEEFQSLRELECGNPAINHNLFPGIRVTNYWTGTPSRRGALFGCSFYTYAGRISCLMRREKVHPLMLVIDQN